MAWLRRPSGREHLCGKRHGALRDPVLFAYRAAPFAWSFSEVRRRAQKKDVLEGTTAAEPQGKRGWSKCEGAGEKAWMGEEGPVAGGTEERVATEAGP